MPRGARFVDRFDDFHNRLRVLLNIERADLVDAGVIRPTDHNAWGTFHRDPFRFFIRADDATALKLWAIVERRATGSIT
ncbi:hypothetical protein [Chelatococcus sp. XZ-Ab1]|uniref:hypothetical protein n=1 Tax=Chelatococcus sp. XZ-Ab1 TaxID=3034027 RepID=UPI0023E36D80|nr:hypothetical protein [Chelatococcus sp. XZ-Ab1]